MKTLSNIISWVQMKHSEQKRKYTGENYTVHLAEVAGLAMKYYHLVSGEVSLPVFLATAWSHDLMEDQGVTTDELILAAVGWELHKDIEDYVFGVTQLSDLEKGNRKERNAYTVKRLSVSPSWVQVIKVCDSISNARSISLHDTDFLPTFVSEKLELISQFNNIPLDLKNETLSYLQGLLDDLNSAQTCWNCGKGKLHRGVKRVGYLDTLEMGRYLYLDALHCTHCNDLVPMGKESSTLLHKKLSKGYHIPF